MKKFSRKEPIFVLLFLLLVGFIGSWELGLIGKKEIPDALHVISTGPVSLDTTIHDVNSVPYLYDAAYALPGVPPFKSFHCPFDNGLVYHLSFLHDTALVQTMDLYASGCQFVRLSSFDTRFPNDSFTRLLAKMLNRRSL